MSLDKRYRIDPRRLRQGSGTSNFLREDGTFAAVSVPVVRVMTSDQSEAGGTLVDVTQLVFPVGANETWAYRFDIMLGQLTCYTGVKIALVIPAGATMRMYADASGEEMTAHFVGIIGTSGLALDLDAGNWQDFEVYSTLRANAYVVTAGTAGNVQVQFASSSGVVDPLTFRAGSFGIGYKAN